MVKHCIFLFSQKFGSIEKDYKKTYTYEMLIYNILRKPDFLFEQSFT